MARQGSGALRVTAIVGFVLTMPVLALPAVNDRLDRWIFGDELAWDAEYTASSELPETNGPNDMDALGPATGRSTELVDSTSVADVDRGAEGDEAKDSANSTPWPNELAAGAPPGRPRLSLVETSTPLERLPLVGSDAETSNGLAPNELLATDRMRAVQTRLERLGASYLRLEELEAGRQERLFRFQCQLPIAGGSAYHRPFLVEHADPLEAMQRVLAEVETWCAARDASRRTWR